MDNKKAEKMANRENLVVKRMDIFIQSITFFLELSNSNSSIINIPTEKWIRIPVICLRTT
jgi:hypothetical protein